MDDSLEALALCVDIVVGNIRMAAQMRRPPGN
jgi:hypothetical protein